MANTNVDVYLEQTLEAWEQCHFNRTLFQPSDLEGLRVNPLKLKVKPSATFRMQPFPANLCEKALSRSYGTSSCLRALKSVIIVRLHYSISFSWDHHGSGLSRSQLAAMYLRVTFPIRISIKMENNRIGAVRRCLRHQASVGKTIYRANRS